jgi:monoamine oxidase
MEKPIEQTKTKVVAIVGAGAAGLDAARSLVTHEAYIKDRLKVVVLEARDRVGGRICVNNSWNAPFDLGLLHL